MKSKKSGVSISLRLFLSNLVYTVPVLVLVYFVVDTMNANIRFADGELKGDAYQKTLEPVMELLSEHRLVAQRALHGDVDAKTTLADLQPKIDAGIQQIKNVDRQYGVDLQFTDQGLAQRKREAYRVSNLDKSWNELKTQVSSLTAAQSNDKHTALISIVRNMITHLGDTSSLILDPDLDSYYLMDVTLVTLPQLQDRIQGVIQSTEELLHKSQWTQEDRNNLIINAALFRQADLDRLTGDIQTALNEDKNFYGVSETLQKRLPPITAELSAAGDALIAMLNQLADPAQKRVSAKEFLTTAHKAMDVSYQMFNVGVEELDVLLRARIGFYAHQRNQALLFSLIALVVAAVISTGLGISIRRSVLAGIRDAVTRIKDASQAIHNTNGSLSDASQSLSTGTSNQATAIQETVATLNEINAMVAKSVGNAEQSAKQAQQGQEVATEGHRAVADMVEAISGISTSNEEIIRQIEEGNRQIGEIVQLIGNIADKTKVINDIVFQTKLLSFNASVEAARAGEHGKGFAVVAEEVGNLAAMSGKAAHEIGQMVSDSIARVKSIVEDTQRRVQTLVTSGKGRMDHGRVTAERCGEVLQQVVDNGRGVSQMMQEIVEASRQQAIGVDEITKAMNQLDQVTHQNAGTAQETAGYASDLAGQADALTEVVTQLDLQLLGGGSPQAPNLAGGEKDVEPAPVSRSLAA